MEVCAKYLEARGNIREMLRTYFKMLGIPGKYLETNVWNYVGMLGNICKALANTGIALGLYLEMFGKCLKILSVLRSPSVWVIWGKNR